MRAHSAACPTARGSPHQASGAAPEPVKTNQTCARRILVSSLLGRGGLVDPRGDRDLCYWNPAQTTPLVKHACRRSYQPHRRDIPLAGTRRRVRSLHRRGRNSCRTRRRRGRRGYEALALPRRRPGALRRRSSSAARAAIRSSSVISCHTVERRAPDRRTCPAASSSCSSLSVRP